ncbi:MAG: hypothetical protein SPL79_03470, partial [Sphaerochaetaceae bacterium]|nr:hypothetical protein [Sphaerochaetaceae bacterium]
LLVHQPVLQFLVDKGAFLCMVHISPPHYHTGVLGGLMHGKKEEIPDYGHNMLQEKEIKLQTKIVHTGRQTPSRLAIPQRPDLNQGKGVLDGY